MRTDEELAKDVADAIRWDDRVDASAIAVDVEDGLVTLTGTVPSYRQRAAAENDARVIPGVAGTDNKLDVAQPRKFPPDAEILREISDRLETDPDIDASHIVVTVEHGRVTLEGTVPAYWDKELAEIVVAAAPGVVGITDKLAVVPVHDIEDEAIAEDLVAALDRNGVDVEDVDVEVAGGIVTLRGTVPDWYTRNVVVETTHYTSGVVDYDDRLLVGEPIPTR